MQLLIDEFAGKEPDFCKKLITACNKKERKDVLAKSKEEKLNAKKLPDVLKDDKKDDKEKDPNQDPNKKEPEKKELACE